MRRYVFHSQLAAEKYLYLLPYRAERYAEGKIRTEIAGDEVQLMDYASLQIYGQIPFVGKVIPEKEGCMVTGGFPVSAVLSWKKMLGMWLLVVLAGRLFGVPLVLMAFFAAVWLALSVGLTVLVNLCMVRRRRLVLQFLEQEMKK